jgi:membrane protease subunit HflC
MKKIIIIVSISVLFVIGLITALTSIYTVNLNEYAVVREFGKIVSVEAETGLHFRKPFIQNVQKISMKTHLYDVPLSDVITSDKKSMIADNYVLWKVTDPTKFIRTLDAAVPRAEERIEAAVYNGLKTVISSMTQEEVIEARGERLTSMLTEAANSDIGEYGIVVLTAEIKSLDLPEDNKDAMYARMISERNNIAAAYTAEGNAEAQKIKNETNKEVKILIADAEKESAIKLATAEAEYMKILAEAYNTEEEADFYEFLRSLDMFVSAMNDDTTILLNKDSVIAKILYGE